MSRPPPKNNVVEVPQILQALDQGTVMIRFFRRKGNKPEKRILCLKMETFEILQYPVAKGKLTQCEETSKYEEGCSGLWDWVLPAALACFDARGCPICQLKCMYCL